MMETINDMEESVLDVDEIDTKEIKINPDYYIHRALVLAENALVKDNMREGFAQFRLMIELIEVLCRAAGKLPEDYEEKVKDFNIDEKDELIKAVKIGNKKLGLIMASVFDNKIIITPLKL